MATRKKAPKAEPTPPRSAWNDGPWNEIAGLVLIGMGLVLTLSLVSYNSVDPSWNSVGGVERATNWIGPVGAKLSDLLFKALGLAAVFVPITLFIAGWWQWQNERPAVPKPKVLGIFLMIVAFTGMLTIIGPENPRSFYLGGFIGRWLVFAPTTGLSYLLGTMGSIVALLILFVIGMLIGTEFSIVAAIVRLTPEQQRQTGVFSSLGQGLKAFRRESLRKPTGELGADETETQRVDQAPAEPTIISRVHPSALRKRPQPQGRLVPGTEIEQTTGAGIGDHLRSAAPPTSKIAAPPGNGAPAHPRQQPAAQRPQKKAGPGQAPHDFYDEGDMPGDDFVGAGSGQQRSVEDMLATASVKRQNLAEDLEKPSAGQSKLGKLVTSISRMAADYRPPSTEMLTPPAPRSEMEETELLERARQLAEKCAEFNVSGQVKQISPGPVVTTFEFKPDPGVKYSRVTSLVDDLCLALKAESIRIDRIPGKSTVGIEVPNSHREIIRLREVIESKKFRESKSHLTMALGKTIDGSNYVADLAKMPHLLIAGATGAGKSVMLNGILVSLLCKSSPDEVKMILVDPKRLELGLYADIPHLLTPIVTDPKRASYALKWAVSEMESRYKHLAAYGVRNIDQYNNEVCANFDRKRADDNPDLPRPLPYIVVVIDELADLMMVSARDVEESITRLAQMARAVGIHLVLATQRPSVDVITGLIKANFPSRISFRVSSKVDSRTIIDTNGAEQLLGNGDMLFLPPGTSRLLRVHGAYVDEKEVKRICDHIRIQGKPDYDEKIVMSDKESEGSEMGDMARDEKYDDAVRIVVQSGKASTSLLQRHLRIGYGRAASIIDMMHREGIVGPEDGSKPRQVLVKPDFIERLEQLRQDNN